MKAMVKYTWLAFTLVLIGASIGLNAQNDETIYSVKLVSFEDLAYPGIARVARIQGVVVVKAKLDEKGNVVAASAISGPKPLIADCLSNAKKWKFQPNSHNAAIIVYEFRLDDGACHDDSHSLFRLVHENFASITACAPVNRG
jgi:hypothetical protein